MRNISTVLSFLSVALLHFVTAVDGLIQKTSTPPLLDVPTYSLATLNEDGSVNMNILTYATPVPTAPARVWSLGLFKDTLSEANLRRSGVCVLQLLSEEHKDAVPVLGSVSGRDVDKKAVCQQLGLEWEDLKDDDGFQVLPGCVKYMKLSIQGGVVDAGTHFIVPFCEVVETYTSSDDDDNTQQQQHLSTGMLRDAGIITEKGRVAEEKQYSVSSAYN